MTPEQLLDIDPVDSQGTAYVVAVRHAWNFAVSAEAAGVVGAADTYANVARAWAAVAHVLKGTP